MNDAPLVLLHGFTGDPSSWDAVVAELAVARRLIRPALVGHRGGPPADASTTWDGEVERLGAIVEIEARPGARGVVLAGYSLGARLALAVALARPPSIARLVLVSPSAGIEHDGERAQRRQDDDALAASIAERGLFSFVERWEALPLFATQESLPPDVRAAHRARRLAQDANSLAASLAALSKGRMPWLLPAAAAVEVETVLVVGELDAAAVEAAARMQAAFRRARTVHVSGAGHDLCLERPDVVAAALAASAPVARGTTRARPSEPIDRPTMEDPT